MKFSQRIGKTPSTKAIQIDSVDDDLINGLWNVIKLSIIDELTQNSGNEFNTFSKTLYHRFYKLPIDLIPDYDHQIEKFIRDDFFNCEWYNVYDLVEFLTQIKYSNVDIPKFIRTVNILLEREFSGYRFIDGVIAPISNEVEIKEIQEAINQVRSFTSLRGANIHLTNALDKISDRKRPDYRNSIKESISAVETTCRILTKESTLGKALKALENKGIDIDNQLKSGFEKIYNYSNNKGSGIRHAIIEDHKNPDFADAKYMLVACSSFINYLIGKCETQGIAIT
jgi:hypothetical protein